MHKCKICGEVFDRLLPHKCKVTPPPRKQEPEVEEDSLLDDAIELAAGVVGAILSDDSGSGTDFEGGGGGNFSGGGASGSWDD